MKHAELVAYCLGKKATTKDTPFGPDTLVFKVMGKLFALTGTEPTSDTVNLKCDPFHAQLLRQTYPETIKPGYHMNKKHWNTVTINTDLDDALICELIDESYDLVVGGLKKADREKLAAMDD